MSEQRSSLWRFIQLKRAACRLDRAVGPPREHVGLGKIAQSFDRVGAQRQSLLDLGHRLSGVASGHEHRAQPTVGIGKIWEKRDDIAVAALGIGERSCLVLRQGGAEELYERARLFHPIDRPFHCRIQGIYCISWTYHFPGEPERPISASGTALTPGIS
jgi:hypothetical protein